MSVEMQSLLGNRFGIPLLYVDIFFLGRRSNKGLEDISKTVRNEGARECVCVCACVLFQLQEKKEKKLLEYVPSSNYFLY